MSKLACLWMLGLSALAGASDPVAEDRAAELLRQAEAQVRVDLTSAQAFFAVAETLDRGEPMDPKTTEASPDGNDLLVIVGNKKDVRIILGERNPDTGAFEIVAHIAWDGETRRDVFVAEGFSLGTGKFGKSIDDQMLAPGQLVPMVQCFSFMHPDNNYIRIVCICYKLDSGGFYGEKCYDTGWIP